MNLQENIHRIHQMMGVISEDKHSKIKKLIDLLGIVDSILYYGGYKNFKEHGAFDVLTTEDKIKVIKDNVGIGINEFIRGTKLSSNNDVGDYLYGIYEYSINVETYDGDTYIGERDLLYEDLSDEMLNKLFESVVGYKIVND